MLLADGALRLKFGTAAARHPYHLERRGGAERAIGAAAPIENKPKFGSWLSSSGAEVAWQWGDGTKFCLHNGSPCG